MGVRGTHFIVSVNPKTGATEIAVVSGIVNTAFPRSDEGEDVLPSTQITIIVPGMDDEDSEPLVIATHINIQVDEEILESIIRNKELIDREQEEFISRIESGDLELPPNMPDLSKLHERTKNIISHIATTALQSGTVSQERIEELIEETLAN